MSDSESYRNLLYQYQVLVSRLEIREYYLKTIVKEVYENIGQVLSLVRIQLALVNPQQAGNEREKIDSSGNLVGFAIRDLRDICQRLLPDSTIIPDGGFDKAVREEIKHLYPDAVYSVIADSSGCATIENKEALILFNILLEIVAVLQENKERKLMAVIINYSNNKASLVMDYSGQAITAGQFKRNRNGYFLSINERAKLLGGSLRLSNEEPNRKKIKLIISINEQYGKNKGRTRR